MLTRDFDFELPEELIAQRALPRGQSRLLVLDAEGEDRHRLIADLPQLLQPGDLLVVNDTRVIPARLFAHRPTGGKVEILLVEPVPRESSSSERSAEGSEPAPEGDAPSLEREVPSLEWEVLVKPGRKARPGTILQLPDGPSLEILSKGDDGRHRARFDQPIEPHLERLGHVPLPPYIKRPDEASDHERYQTVFARHPGAIAAPTAGLHFSDELLQQLEDRGIRRTTVTLHVGIGTFKPVTAELAHEHVMDRERWRVSEEAAEAIRSTRAAGGRIVAVGTTVVRTLESAARASGGEILPGSGNTDLFIRPGFPFQAVDLLLTNFHLPRSTLLMLVSALAGRERVLDAYREAVERRYRFYSYGDAMLVGRGEG
ncbi:MAG: tRNA preQ1(34) S-adenosylmethionine ribosyltransferase-isomerase QueA [Acidobacteriota bacterium]|nr:tRNA preQ1(34) S-adenosylmethionine ribosyltransferase-isomerase QueA [Acidobacteriota bacterium]